MIVETLEVHNLRAIRDAGFSFSSGFNLIVGVNGVGKTSILDALGVCLSAVLRQTNRPRIRSRSFADSDIRIGAPSLDIKLGVRIDTRQYSYVIHNPRESSVPKDAIVGMPRDQVHDTPRRSEFIGAVPPQATHDSPHGRPFAILFSTKRAVPSERVPSKASAAGGVAAALADVFTDRELRLAEFELWIKAQESIRSEHPAAARLLNACEDAVSSFLPAYRNLRIAGEGNPSLVIDQGSMTIPVRQLSDGERGILALVLDLTRRLAQANPELDNPASEAAAVVLIDEIELHLHPKWQRQIVRNLLAAFPQCQFIATTHSPQVIGEVPHTHIQIISDGMVYSPPQSFGVDSSRVLEEIMDANRRNADIADLLSDVSGAIVDNRLDHAQILLDRLIERLDENDPEVIRLRTLLSFLESE